MGTTARNCLVCSIDLQDFQDPKYDGGNFQKNHRSVEMETDTRFYAANMDAIFLVRKLLEIPMETSCQLLQKFGNPSHWAICCGSCSRIAAKGRNIFNQLTRLEKEFKLVQTELKYFIQVSPEVINYNDCGQEVKEIIVSSLKQKWKHTTLSETEIKIEGCETLNQDKPEDIYPTDLSLVWSETLRKQKPIFIAPALATKSAKLIAKSSLEEWKHPTLSETEIKIEDFETLNEDKPEDNSPTDLSLTPIDTPPDRYLTTLTLHAENLTNPDFTSITKTVIRTETESLSIEPALKPRTSSISPIKSSAVLKRMKPVTPSIFSASIPLIKLSHPCTICREEFEDGIQLQAHAKFHIEERPHTCKYCRKCFKLPSHLKEHIRIHTGERPYGCKFCDKRFMQSSALKCHTRTHSGEKRFECGVCGRKFSTKNGMISHQTTHEIKDLPHECDICGKCYKLQGLLTQHMSVHTGERPFHCQYCPKKFRVSGHLTEHIRIHTGECPYKCGICQMGFRQSCRLRSHIAQHAKAVNYGCFGCGQSFASLTELQEHVKSHKGETSYQCDYCAMRFSNFETMTEHVNKHTSQTEYGCDLCGVCFYFVKHLNDHKELHFQKEREEYCGEVYVQSKIEPQYGTTCEDAPCEIYILP